MAGALNSVSKFTGALSSGVAALCMDKEYLEQREIMRAKKPKHVIDGFNQGVRSMVDGITKGVSGYFFVLIL
jgi:vacuolar protein sorting-associated protein 13A/C